MKRIVAILLLIACVFALGACADTSGVPDGMQLARGSDAVGYYFYVPDSWTVSSVGDISAAYASVLDASSVSYTELSSVPCGSFSDYFDECLTEFKTAPTVITRAEAVTFGNAEAAEKFVYDHEYSGHKFRTMQIFARYENRFGIFTYTSYNENKSASDKTQYDFHLDEVQGVLDNFKYVKITEDGRNSESYPLVDGYYLVSNKDTAKFSLYLPEGFKVSYSDGSVLAELSDLSNISMMRATATGTDFSSYYERRKTELSAIVDSFTEIKKDQSIAFGNATAAFLYEYTYEFSGEVYHVYQVLSKTTFDGFVFTYTAKEECYSEHLPVIDEIIKRVEV